VLAKTCYQKQVFVVGEKLKQTSSIEEILLHPKI
jgi:hypothetical protein